MTREQKIRALGGVGILTPRDIDALGAGVIRVLKLMMDGSWHTREEVCMAAGEKGVPAQAGDRRMRELRTETIDVERRRVPGKRRFEYRLVRAARFGQRSMF